MAVVFQLVLAVQALSEDADSSKGGRQGSPAQGRLIAATLSFLPALAMRQIVQPHFFSHERLLLPLIANGPKPTDSELEPICYFQLLRMRDLSTDTTP